MKFNFQGLNAISLFRGKSATKPAKLIYAESAVLFADAIKSHLPVEAYTLLDLGSHKGEFLEDLVEKLRDYSFDAIAVDVNEADLKDNPAETKIAADLITIPLGDKSVDITIARYAIAWNNAENQKRIIKEIGRLTRTIAIIQHQGSDPEHPHNPQTAARELFRGKIPELKREEFYFSSATEVEAWFTEFGFKFERIQHRRVEDISELYIEKYRLEGDNAEAVRNILAGADYLWQTAWVVTF